MSRDNENGEWRRQGRMMGGGGDRGGTGRDEREVRKGTRKV